MIINGKFYKQIKKQQWKILILDNNYSLKSNIKCKNLLYFNRTTHRFSCDSSFVLIFIRIKSLSVIIPCYVCSWTSTNDLYKQIFVLNVFLLYCEEKKTLKVKTSSKCKFFEKHNFSIRHWIQSFSLKYEIQQQ